MTGKLKGAEVKKKPWERRKENLSRFIQKWKDLMATFTNASRRSKGIINEDEVQFFEINKWLSQNYARIEPEIRLVP